MTKHGGLVVGSGHGRLRVGGRVMSAKDGKPVRGYRPGRCGMSEEEDDRAQIVRLANVEIYAKRARAGLPIFRGAEKSHPALSVGKSNLIAT